MKTKYERTVENITKNST